MHALALLPVVALALAMAPQIRKPIEAKDGDNKVVVRMDSFGLLSLDRHIGWVPNPVLPGQP